MIQTKDSLNVALVTGAAGGIGLAIARKLYENGMNICAWDIRQQDSRLIGPDATRIISQAVDITDKEAVQRALDVVAGRWGGVSVLVNNAGISPKDAEGKGMGILAVSEQEWANVIDVNLTAVLRLTQLSAPFMIKQGWGRIINIASQAGRTRAAVPGIAYICTKTAVIGLSRYAADEFGPKGITVNTLAPGRITSEMTATAGEAVNAAFVARTPVRRLGTPEDVAVAAAFYASEHTSFLNGTVLDVNGGLYMP